MNQYYLWCVVNDEAHFNDNLHQGIFHAVSIQDAWGHFMEDLKEQGFDEQDILFKGGCEVALNVKDEKCVVCGMGVQHKMSCYNHNRVDAMRFKLLNVKLLKEEELHDNRH